MNTNVHMHTQLVLVLWYRYIVYQNKVLNPGIGTNTGICAFKKKKKNTVGWKWADRFVYNWSGICTLYSWKKVIQFTETPKLRSRTATRLRERLQDWLILPSRRWEKLRSRLLWKWNKRCKTKQTTQNPQQTVAWDSWQSPLSDYAEKLFSCHSQDTILQHTCTTKDCNWYTFSPKNDKKEKKQK